MVRAASEKPVLPGLTVRGLLGRGGTADVWLAEDADGRRVAAKVLRPDAPAEVVERVRAAGMRLVALRHPALVATLAAGEAAGRPYLVLEHVEGRTLLDLVRENGPLSEAEARDVGIQAARGLRAAARGGVLHGDVEPGNLLVDPAGRVLVGDLDPAGGPGLFGTPAFMAPERLAGGAGVTEAGDVYALGVTLFFAVTGELPHPVGPVTEMLPRILADPLPDPRERRPGISEDFVRLLRAMTAPDPADRPATWDRALDAMASGRGPRRAVRAVRRAMRGPVRLALAGVLLVSLALLAVGLFARGDPPPRLDAETEAEARGAAAEVERRLADGRDTTREACEALLAIADRYPGTVASERARMRAMAILGKILEERERALAGAVARAGELVAASAFDRALAALEEARPAVAGSPLETRLDHERDRVLGLAAELREALREKVEARLRGGDLDGAIELLEAAPRDAAGGLGEWVELTLEHVRLRRDSNEGD